MEHTLKKYNEGSRRNLGLVSLNRITILNNNMFIGMFALNLKPIQTFDKIDITYVL